MFRIEKSKSPWWRWASLCVGILSLSACSIYPWNQTHFEPEQAAKLTQAQKWAIELEVWNEANHQTGFSRQFPGIADLPKRKAWALERARQVESVDILLQLFRQDLSGLTHHHAPMDRMIALGKRGDPGAACLAHWLTFKTPSNFTQSWQVPRAEVAKIAYPMEATGHPLCQGIQVFRAWIEDPKAKPVQKTAHPLWVKAAVAGNVYAARELGNWHIGINQTALSTQQYEHDLCWRNVASAFDQEDAPGHGCSRTRVDAFAGPTGPAEWSDAHWDIRNRYCKDYAYFLPPVSPGKCVGFSVSFNLILK